MMLKIDIIAYIVLYQFCKICKSVGRLVKTRDKDDKLKERERKGERDGGDKVISHTAMHAATD